jgi:hypothetical protein
MTAASYSAPGTYTVTVGVPPVRGSATVEVAVWDAHQLCASDTWQVSLHSRYARLLKWFLAAPTLASAAAVAWALSSGNRQEGRQHLAQD